jgi:hypothetical protein
MLGETCVWKLSILFCDVETKFQVLCVYVCIYMYVYLSVYVYGYVCVCVRERERKRERRNEKFLAHLTQLFIPHLC